VHSRINEANAITAGAPSPPVQFHVFKPATLQLSNAGIFSEQW
jgi:hypothetical protein